MELVRLQKNINLILKVFRKMEAKWGTYVVTVYKVCICTAFQFTANFCRFTAEYKKGGNRIWTCSGEILPEIQFRCFYTWTSPELLVTWTFLVFTSFILVEVKFRLGNIPYPIKKRSETSEKTFLAGNSGKKEIVRFPTRICEKSRRKFFSEQEIAEKRVKIFSEHKTTENRVKIFFRAGNYGKAGFSKIIRNPSEISRNRCTGIGLWWNKWNWLHWY